MTATELIASILFANGLTLAAIYGFWRIRRDGQDTLGLAICAIAGLSIAAIGYLA
jgi:hypothetical protein